MTEGSLWEGEAPAERGGCRLMRPIRTALWAGYSKAVTAFILRAPSVAMLVMGRRGETGTKARSRLRAEWADRLAAVIYLSKSGRAMRLGPERF